MVSLPAGHRPGWPPSRSSPQGDVARVQPHPELCFILLPADLPGLLCGCDSSGSLIVIPGIEGVCPFLQNINAVFLTSRVVMICQIKRTTRKQSCHLVHGDWTHSGLDPPATQNSKHSPLSALPCQLSLVTGHGDT